MADLNSWEDDPAAQDDNLSRRTQQQLNLNQQSQNPNPQAGAFRPGAQAFQPGAQAFQPGAQAFQPGQYGGGGYPTQYQQYYNQPQGFYPQYGAQGGQPGFDQYQGYGAPVPSQGGYNNQGYGMVAPTPPSPLLDSRQGLSTRLHCETVL